MYYQKVYKQFTLVIPYLYFHGRPYTCVLLGVGGIEAEAVMLGQAISMILPQVVGCKLSGEIGPLVTSTDVVLTITKVNCYFST